jgi:hypothetical protein
MHSVLDSSSFSKQLQSTRQSRLAKFSERAASTSQVKPQALHCFLPHRFHQMSPLEINHYAVKFSLHHRWHWNPHNIEFEILIAAFDDKNANRKRCYRYSDFEIVYSY